MRYLFLFSIITVYLFGIDFNSIKTFQSTFKQSIINPSGKELNYKGKLYILESNNILWQYTTPIVKNVYIKKDFVIVDEPELEQVIYTQIDKEINLLTMIANAKQIDKNHYVATMNNIQYNIYTKDDKIDFITYVDSLENNIKISFIDSIYNEDIDGDLLVFKIPSHYDIIRK